MPASLEQVEQTVARLHQAAEASRTTASRQGNVVVLGPAEADEVFLTGDLHGNRANFERLLHLADLDGHPRRHLVLQEVCHGGPTYPQGGGCMSHTLLEDVAALKVRYPDRLHFLLGNHELAELVGLPIQKNRQILNLVFRVGLEQHYGPAMGVIREAYAAFFRRCPLAVRLASGLFISHSLPERVDVYGFDADVFKRPLELHEFSERGPVFDLLWGRDYREANAAAFAELVGTRLLINGHEPCAEGHISPNRRQIILDCCGRRACYLILPTDREFTHDEVLARVATLRE